MQKVGPCDSSNIDLFFDPGGTGSGKRLLRQDPVQFNAPVLIQPEGLGFIPRGIHGADSPRLAIKKTRAGGVLQYVAHDFIRIDGEIRRDNGQVRAGLDSFPEEVPDAALHIVDNGVRPAGPPSTPRRVES